MPRRSVVGVVHHAQEVGKDGLAHHVGEGLTLVLVLLAVPFHPVTEDLVEEDPGGLALQDGGAGEGLQHGGPGQVAGALGRPVGAGEELLPAGQALQGRAVCDLVHVEQHAVVGSSAGPDAHSIVDPGVLQQGALAGRHHVGLGLGAQVDAAVQNPLRVQEDRAEVPGQILPDPKVHAQVLDLADIDHRVCRGEVRAGVVPLDLHGLVRAHLGEPAHAALPGLVGLPPQHGGGGVGVAVQGQLDQASRLVREPGRVADLVGVVELGPPHAYVDVGVAVAVVAALPQRAVARGDVHAVRVHDPVAQVVGGVFSVGQGDHDAVDLSVGQGKYGRRLGGQGRGHHQQQLLSPVRGARA